MEVFQSKDALAVFAGTVAVLIYMIAFRYYLTLSRDRRRLRQFRLRDAISTGLINGTLATTDDFINIYKGVHGPGADDVSYLAGLAKSLREYMVDIVSDDELPDAKAKQLKQSASSVLTQIEADSPFADLPAAERNLLIDVDRFLKANDQQSARSKIEDLAGLIEVRQDSLGRVKASNKWAVPLAVVGLVLTIILASSHCSSEL